MKLQINWSNNFLNSQDSFEFISFAKNLKFSLDNVLDDWVSNPYAEIGKIQNTISLFLLLGILREDKDRRIYLSKDSQFKNRNNLEADVINKLLKKCSDTVLEFVPFDKLEFNEKKTSYGFYRNSSPIEYSGGLNLLVNYGVLEQSDSFYAHIIDERLVELIENKVVSAIKTVGKITPEALRRLIDLKEIIGQESEEFAYEFELSRLKKLGVLRKPLQVSLIDVSKGFDIASYQNETSTYYDRFIEVKTFSSNNFYISKNEFLKAKELQDNYYIYLVCKNPNDNTKYVEVIRNPASLFGGDTWGIEPDNFIVTKLA